MVAQGVDPHVLVTLFSAAYNGDLNAVKAIIKERGISVDAVDPAQGSTALQWASFGGSLEVVKWLVKTSGASVTHKNKDDRTAFFFACEHCHKPVAAFLLQQGGVDVNAKDGPSGHTVLHRACIAAQTRGQAGAEELIQWLLTSAGADPELGDKNGRIAGEADLSVEAPTLKPWPRAADIRGMMQEFRKTLARGTEVEEPLDPAPQPTAEPVPPSQPEPEPEPEPEPKPAIRSRSGRGGMPASRPSVTDRAAMLSKGSVSPGTAAHKSAQTAAPTKAPIPATMNRSASPPKKTVTNLAVAVGSGSTATEAGAGNGTGVKPRPGGVLPRTGGGLPVSGSAAAPGSPARATAAAAEAVTSATSGPEKPGKGTIGSPGVSGPAGRSSYVRSSPSKGAGAGVGSPTAAPASTIAARYQLRPTPTPSSSSSPAKAPSDGPAGSSKSSPIAARYQRSLAASSGGSQSPAAASGTAANSNASSSSGVRYHRSVPGGASAPMAGQGGGAGSKHEDEKKSAGGTTPVVARFQRSISNQSTGSTGAAEAVIAASNGPKASALAAAFESKARNRQGLPAPRRGDLGLSASALAKRTPAPAISHSSSSSSGSSTSSNGDRQGSPDERGGKGNQNGFSFGRFGNGNGTSDGPGAGGGSGASAPAPRMTPEELLGTGSVMKKKQVYVAAAQRSSQASPKETPAPASKGKKVKEPPSFMDKVVSMFSISPQSSRESSPASRSPSRSPKGTKSKAANASVNPPAKNGHEARLGFFHSNLSFKFDPRDPRDKE